MYVCVCMGVCCIGPNEGISMCNVEGNMKIHWEAPASLKTELLSGNLAPLVSIFFLGLRGVFHVVLSHIVDCAGKVSLRFPARLQWLKGRRQSWKDYATCLQVLSMLCTTGFCTELHTVEAGNEYALSLKSPIILRWSRCVWWLHRYWPSALKTTVSSNHLCLGGSDLRFNAALPLHAFCTQVQVNFRNGLTHLFLLPLAPAMWRDFASRTNIVNNSSARIMARDPMLGRAKQCRQVFRS